MFDSKREVLFRVHFFHKDFSDHLNSPPTVSGGRFRLGDDIKSRVIQPRRLGMDSIIRRDKIALDK